MSTVLPSSALLSHLNLLMYFLGVIPVASCRASNDFSLCGFLSPTGVPSCPPCSVTCLPVTGFTPTAFQVLPFWVALLILNSDIKIISYLFYLILLTYYHNSF